MRKQVGKRWLMSRLKTSGSKRTHVLNGTYAETRHSRKNNVDPENLPQKESVRKSWPSVYNGKINSSLLVRFLHNQVGNDWNDVHSEIIGRIPTKLLDYKEMVYWYVADQVEFIDGKIWNKRTQRFIRTTNEPWNDRLERSPFYVDPATNKLVRTPSPVKQRST